MPNLRPDPAPPRLPVELTPASPDELDGAFQMQLEGAAYVDLAEAEIEQCRFTKVSFAGAQGAAVTFVDSVFDRCDLANAALESSGLRRAVVQESRLTGLSFINGMVRDVVFRESKLDLTNWRVTTFHSVHFVQCDLTRAEFGGADLRGVEFIDCSLMGAQFSSAKVTGVRFTGCDLSGIGGVASLAGATISTGDPLPLIELFAAELGITLELS